MKKLYQFFLVNIFISSLIAIRYFCIPGVSFSMIGKGFAFIAVLGHFFLLYLLIFIICSLFLWMNKQIFNTLLIIQLSFFQILLLIDTIVFAQYRFHINQSVLSLVFSGQVVDFSLATYLLIAAIVLVILIIETIILKIINKNKKYSFFTKQKCQSKPNRFIFLITCLLGLCLLASQVFHMIAFYYAYTPIIVIKEYIPLYHPLTSKKIMSVFDNDGQRKVLYYNDKINANIHYPKEPLIINPHNQAVPNIMFIVLDSWRYDTFNSDNTPNTYQFVKQHNGVIFNNHYSTGNATRTGIFGLFYGIPGTYWDAFLRNSIPSLFVTTLQQQNYNIGIFTSAKISSPEFDRNAFVTIENIRITSKGETVSERDEQLTKDWLKWYQERDKNRPTFSFLFYDAPHGYDFPKDFPLKYEPITDLNYFTLNNDTDPVPIFNRYKQSVYYDDFLMQQIYNELLKTGDLQNTLIIITGDHAQEMNDNKLGYWGHNGNYTDAQTKVPFIIINGQDNKLLMQNSDNLTSHEDVVPTLMQHHLHVKNDIKDYSTGWDLYKLMEDRHWLLMSNYSSYAIKTDHDIYLVNRLGIGRLTDLNYREIDSKPNYQYITDALNNMSYFFNNNKSNKQ